MSGGRMSGGRMSGGRLSGGLMSGGLMSAHRPWQPCHWHGLSVLSDSEWRLSLTLTLSRLVSDSATDYLCVCVCVCVCEM